MSTLPLVCLLTCEHAGNEVPPETAHIFKGKEEVLYTHKAIDLGAHVLARHLERALHLPLYVTTVTRLLVEANRSLDSDELFSKFSKKLSEAEKHQVLEAHYHPHRNQVLNRIEEEIAKGNRVLHLAVHTFTPALDGDVRKADIGLLFDPAKPLEKKIAGQFKTALEKQNPQRHILYNDPYPGTADGFPTYLRSKLEKDQYAGFELEVNQKFFLSGDPDAWETVKQEIGEALKTVLQKYQEKRRITIRKAE
ncbi:N-formylglutamate amidohydrolase [Nibribacter ruber]|uniref:N-formylglutamate amidohydrolase n=1 Tax=Nibribacter ruber TaxID=2698458 RepID=A0A6P1NZJ2_9BACT|nr:N-formylglutamate amidohydrolase [Nibribacter ruber]QHL85982.1 N-formylglutamate amidohydrolase [Nibribacter ruber]